MKKFIMATVIAACIALCAVVWPQSKAPEETPVLPPDTRCVRQRSDYCGTKNRNRNNTTGRERKRSSSANKSTLGDLR